MFFYMFKCLFSQVLKAGIFNKKMGYRFYFTFVTYLTDSLIAGRLPVAMARERERQRERERDRDRERDRER